MDLHVVALVMLAVLIHPLRDFVLKGNAYPEAAYFGVILFWAAIASVQAQLLGVDVLSALAVWPLVVFSALGLAFYYVGILTTMKTGDLSIYYPIIRAAPVFIVVVGWLFLGHRYNAVMLGGVALVMIGAFFLQYRRGAQLLHQPATLATALLAMCGMGTQSLADAEAMKTIEPAALLVGAYVLLAPVCAVYFIVRKPPERKLLSHLFGGWRQTPFRYVGAALSSYLSYYLILLSYQFGGNVGAVNSLRQASIPLAVLLGGLYLREQYMQRRLGWSLVLALGIVVIIFSK